MSSDVSIPLSNYAVPMPLSCYGMYRVVYMPWGSYYLVSMAGLMHIYRSRLPPSAVYMYSSSTRVLSDVHGAYISPCTDRKHYPAHYLPHKHDDVFMPP